ncbi:MAG: ATP-binding protein [Candidatus Hadarchaeales archaeon]
MEKFHNRLEELNLLREKLRRDRGELVIIYGRRRVGKTELVRQFLREVGGVYLYIDYCEPAELLRLLSKDVREQSGEFVEFGSWDSFLEWLSTQRVVVLDEFQRLQQVSPAAITRLQRLWDDRLKSEKILLILVGSSIGMLRKVAMGGTAPLYGRATSQFKLEPFRYTEARGMFEGSSERERIGIYGVFGGTPYYLQFVEAELGLLGSVEKNVLRKGSPLLDEPLFLLRTELKEVTRYNSILAAIAEGKRTLKEISDASGIHINKLMYYIENLRDLMDLIELRKPVLGKEKMGRYNFKDNFFRFWYRFVLPNRSLLERGETEKVLSRVEAELDSYLGPVFEEVVRELLIRYNGRNLNGFQLDFDEIGSWWDRVGNEIDICARGKERVLIGEVKWGRDEVGTDLLDSLHRKSEILPWKGKKDLLLVSAGGFTKECRREAESEKVLHLDLSDIGRLFDALAGTTK